jgi:hypothetical protein
MENQNNNTKVIRIKNGYMVVKKNFDEKKFQEKREKFNQRLMEATQKNYLDA